MPNSTVSLQPKVSRRKNADLHQCLKQYAMAALGVAGVSAVATAQPPAHHIWYTQVNIPLNSLTPSVVPIDFNHDGIADFTISATGTSFNASGHGGGGHGSVNVIPAAGNFAIGGHALPQGLHIAQGGPFKSAKQQLASAYSFQLSGSTRAGSHGAFKNITNKYLGVLFQINGQPHEGWIRLTLTCQGIVTSGAITGFAFDTVANEYTLAAGQIRAPFGGKESAQTTMPVKDAVPGSLGMLALGSSAIPFWRE